MPNWVGNTLVVSGDKEELKKFKKFASSYMKEGSKFPDRVLDAEKFIPYPEKFRKLDKIAHDWEDKSEEYAKSLGCDGWYNSSKEGAKNLTDEQRAEFKKLNGDRPKDGFNQSGYEFCCSQWGSKWGFCSPSLNDDVSGELHYYYDSAWSPLLPVIEKMGKMFPKLRFENNYEEPGNGFAGTFIMENGECIENSDRDLTSCPECGTELEKVEDDVKDKDKYYCPECGCPYYWDNNENQWQNEKGEEV